MNSLNLDTRENEGEAMLDHDACMNMTLDLARQALTLAEMPIAACIFLDVQDRKKQTPSVPIELRLMQLSCVT
jgi:hypothetical protein